MKLKLLIGWLLTWVMVCSGYGQTADRFYQQGSYEKAAALYLKQLKKHPHHQQVKVKLARTCFHLGMMNESVEYYSSVISKRYLVNSKDYLKYAQALWSNKADQQAKFWAQKYLQYEPKDLIAQNILYLANKINRDEPYQSTAFSPTTTRLSQSIPQGPTKAILLKITGMTGNKSYVLSTAGVIEVKGLSRQPSNWLEQLMHENNFQIEQRLHLDPIHYQRDQIEVDEKYYHQLDLVASLMNKYPFLEFEISSFTDSRGNEDYNQRLSEKRLQTVTNYLNEKGVRPDRLLGIAHGEFQSAGEENILGNNTGKTQNYQRRTEFRLIYMDDNQVVSNY